MIQSVTERERESFTGFTKFIVMVDFIEASFTRNIFLFVFYSFVYYKHYDELICTDILNRLDVDTHYIVVFILLKVSLVSKISLKIDLLLKLVSCFQYNIMQ